jgi:hypothetical protein
MQPPLRFFVVVFSNSNKMLGMHLAVGRNLLEVLKFLYNVHTLHLKINFLLPPHLRLCVAGSRLSLSDQKHLFATRARCCVLLNVTGGKVSA